MAGLGDAELILRVVRPVSLVSQRTEQVPTISSQGMESPSTLDTFNNVLRDECNFISNVSQFYNQEALSDVIIRAGNQVFWGHKFVLAKSSDVFRTMLYERRWSVDEKAELHLSEAPECEAVFDRFLRYMYSSEISISMETAVGILCLSDKYNVSSLKTLCTKYMVDHTKSPRVRNALNWYSWAKVLHMDRLIEQCTRTIVWNIKEILDSQQWMDMDVNFISDILSSSELVIKDEFTLFKALGQWLLLESHVPDLPEYSSKLLPLIRFPQMQVHELHEIENCLLAQREECKAILHGLINKAYRFRSLCPTQNQLGITFDETFYTPRDYMDMTVDNVRMHNTLRFGIQVDVRTGVGPVPSECKDGEWKIIYRKTNDSWNLQLYCHESAMIQNEARIQASVIVLNEDEKVIQVDRVGTYRCSRGNHLNLQVAIENQEEAKCLAVLIKPVPL